MQHNRTRPARLVRSLTAVGVAAVLLAGAGRAVASTAWIGHLQTGSHAQARGDTAPAAPTGVTATCQGLLSGNVIVGWSAVTRASSYQVYRATSSGGPYAAVGSTVTSTSTTVTPGLLGTGTFYFEVQALSGTNWAGALSAFAGPRTITLALLCI